MHRAKGYCLTVPLSVNFVIHVQNAVGLHSCLKTLVTANSAEILRLSHTLTPKIPPQCALCSFLEFHEKYLELPSEGNVRHRTA